MHRKPLLCHIILVLQVHYIFVELYENTAGFLKNGKLCIITMAIKRDRQL